MFRAVIGSLGVLVLCVALVSADDSKDKKNTKDSKHSKAKIVKVDAKKGTVTLKMNKDGKDVEKTFKLAEDIRYMDSTGKVAVADIFVSGDDVLVLEREGRIKEIKKNDKNGKNDKNDKNKKNGDKNR